MEREPLIIALNFTERDKALYTVDMLRPFVKRFKIGLPLFVKYGYSIIKDIQKYDTNIFLDLKLHDIPSVVSQTIENINDLDIEFLTIHLQGGKDLAKAAMKSTSTIKLLGVTILTSIKESEFKSIYGISLNESVIKLASVAASTGLYGVVCSGLESQEIKRHFPKLKTIVPGIRLKDNKDDQNRVLSPCDALKRKADFLVVGRDITHYENITERIKLYLEEINQCGYI